eukprot:12880843-Prorocentrum_lima.AAC.1
MPSRRTRGNASTATIGMGIVLTPAGHVGNGAQIPALSIMRWAAMVVLPPHQHRKRRHKRKLN